MSNHEWVHDPQFLKSLLKDFIELIESNRGLLDTNNVQFLVENHWENPKYLNEFLKNDLELFLNETDTLPANLIKYFALSEPLPKFFHLNSLLEKLRNLFQVWDKQVCTEQTELLKTERQDLNDFNKMVDEKFSIILKQNRFMNLKKSYEVDHMSKFVGNLCRKHEIYTIVDIGSGRAYLSSQLSSSVFDNKFNVIAIDSSQSNVESSIKRINIMKNNKTAFSPSGKDFKTFSQFIHSSTELNDLIRVDNKLVDYGLIGLHSCGNLSNSIINLYLNNQETERKLLCNVACCYNLLNEKYGQSMIKTPGIDQTSFFPMSFYLNEIKYTLSYNMKIQACHSLFRCLDSIDDFKELDNQIRWYRCVLQTIVYDNFKSVFSADPDSTDFNVSVGQKLISSSGIIPFVDYVRSALKKLKLNHDQLTDEMIQEYFDKYVEMKPKFDVYIQLKSILSAVVENLILLDRLIFLYESDPQGTLRHFLVKLFDPAKSPRCHALISFTK